MLAQTVIDLVESNYCFEDEQAETWKSVKKELLKCEVGRDDRSTECEWIDRLLCRLGDPHLRLFNTHINAYLFNVVLGWEGERLIHYDFDKNECNEVTAVNGVLVEKILENKRNAYPCMNESFVRKEILADAKNCRGVFNAESLELKYRDEDRAIVHIERKSIEDMKKLAQNTGFKFTPIMSKRLDEDTVLLKFLTFGIHELKKHMETIVSQIEGQVRNVVLDLRGNTGGFINEAESLVSAIAETDIEYDYYVRSRDEDKQIKFVKSEQDSFFSGKRMCILMDENTASSAEFVFIKGLRISNPRIMLIGETTAGSSGQAKNFLIDNETVLLVTLRRYIDKESNRELTSGIEPDHRIGSDKNVFDSNQDEKYISWIKNNKALVFNP
ncbi:MAG: hypothetical protein J5739_05880 [Lachnospiraceae bacterium]|nr:hypothetical protein [Lachnospiraceae bacterium]